MIRLYNVLRKFCYLSNVKETKVVEVPEDEVVAEEIENSGLNKALDTYRKLIDRKDLVEPLTEKEQENLENRIKEIENREVLDKSIRYSREIVDSLGGFGIYGVELLLDRNGDLLVSEVAPRPHDTGFVTLLSQNLSEFPLHLRAALNLPIPGIKLLSPAASHAIYTDLDDVEYPRYQGLSRVMSEDDVDLRIFGKPKTYRGRRMAVVIARGSSVDEARRKARRAASNLEIAL
jgi:phosphoribosylglycinamide formyltransferase 2